MHVCSHFQADGRVVSHAHRFPSACRRHMSRPPPRSAVALLQSRKILVSEVTASGRSARKQHNRFGTEITHWCTDTGGMTRSTKCAAVCAMRQPLHDGQTPLPLHENATTTPWPQPLHLSPTQTRSRGRRIPNTGHNVHPIGSSATVQGLANCR